MVEGASLFYPTVCLQAPTRRLQAGNRFLALRSKFLDQFDPDSAFGPFHH
jgi:hypothetical protein